MALAGARAEVSSIDLRLEPLPAARPIAQRFGEPQPDGSPPHEVSACMVDLRWLLNNFAETDVVEQMEQRQQLVDTHPVQLVGEPRLGARARRKFATQPLFDYLHEGTHRGGSAYDLCVAEVVAALAAYYRRASPRQAIAAGGTHIDQPAAMRRAHRCRPQIPHRAKRRDSGKTARTHRAAPPAQMRYCDAVTAEQASVAPFHSRPTSGQFAGQVTCIIN
jgi:hypothetical protein